MANLGPLDSEQSVTISDGAGNGVILGTTGSPLVAKAIQNTASDLKMTANGVYTATPIALTGGQTYPLQLTAAGELRVSPAGSTGPSTTGAGEALALRAYQTTYEYNMVVSGTEYPVIQFKNLSGSGKRIHISQITFSSLVKDKGVIVRVYANPTVTTPGPAIGSTSMFIGGGASASSTLISIPVISSPGTKLSAVATISAQGILDYDWGLLVAANNSLLVTATGDASNLTVVVNIIWTEAIA